MNLMRLSLLSYVAVGLLAALGFAVVPAEAQRRPAQPKVRPKDRPLDRLQRMTPVERKRALEDLPPARRRQLEQRLERFDHLSPEDRARVDRFREFSSDRQQSVRRAFGDLNQMRPRRQDTVRRELRDLRGLSEADRRSRLDSSDFRERFGPREREVIEQLSDVVPR